MAVSDLSARQHFDEGVRLKGAGDLPGALEAYRASLKVNPLVAAGWIGLAEVLEANQQPGDALECLKRAVAVEPESAPAVTRYGWSLLQAGQIEAAEAAYTRALFICSTYVPALLGLGKLHEDAGQPEQAAARYREVLAEDPIHAEALANLLGLGRAVDIGVEIERAQAAIKTLDERETALIGYGLGKALDRLGRYEEAFAALATANVARRSQAGAFHRKRFDRRLEYMMHIFSQGFFEDRAGWGDPSQTPVLVVGLPRSGTTLTEQIIGSHPDCFGAGELPFLTDLATATPNRLGRPDPPWPQSALELTEIQITEIGTEYNRRLEALANANELRIVDKQPLNFWHLGLVALALPNAKIIHCRRDIRDNGFSIYAQNFNPQQRWATDLGDIAHYWRGYRKLMDHWARVTGLQILDVVYEDTVADLEGQSRRLLGFLDLPWDDRVLDFHNNDRAVQTPSKWQVRQPLYVSSKAKWRHYEAQLLPLSVAAGVSNV